MESRAGWEGEPVGGERRGRAAGMRALLAACVHPLQERLDEVLDVRLVRTLLAPHYRLRHAPARLWSAYPIPFVMLNSG
jgi:hypothetical protein